MPTSSIHFYAWRTQCLSSGLDFVESRSCWRQVHHRLCGQGSRQNTKTVVLERNVHGEGQHRCHGGFLGFARHCGFVIKLCQPFRASTMGKAERFNGYLRRLFSVALASLRHRLKAVLRRLLMRLAVGLARTGQQWACPGRRARHRARSRGWPTRSFPGDAR
jgi:transposase